MKKDDIKNSKVKFDRAVRYQPDCERGLDAAQVAERVENNYTNFNATVKTKSVSRIIMGNLLTIFNIINIILAAALIYVGSYKNTAFLGVITANVFIGVIQEIRAKRATDKLSFMSQSKSTVIRDGKIFEISVEDIVLDEVIIFKGGNQVTADCVILSGECEVNESFVTGESEPVYKKPGDTVLSGSFISGGECRARADKTANQTYISSISKLAKEIKDTRSVLMKSIRRIMNIISIAIFPIGVGTFMFQYSHSGHNIQTTIEKTSGLLTGMIPQGLLLLTSTALALSIIRLSKKKVLVADLYCIEMLARVDTICLDKTGTLTEGKMAVENVVIINGNENLVHSLISDTAAVLGDENETMKAISDCFKTGTGQAVKSRISFSSKTKWSGVVFKNSGVIIGAPEYILPGDEYLSSIVEKYTNEYRVLLVAATGTDMEFGMLPGKIEPIALILLKDKIRKEAADFIEYLKRQEIDIKVISGDNPATVSEISKEVGVPDYDKYIDCSRIKDDNELKKAALTYTVFGRVTPFQKKVIVLALKNKKRTVAMTGDGVNDVLAMKEADCSVAMGSGTDAARNVAKIVLLESNFDSLPSVIAEGRRSVNNIQRASSLFLVKTLYTLILSLFYLIESKVYPFEPIQISLVSTVAIGIPSFILAFQPNRKKIQGGFVKNVLLTSLPGAVTIALVVMGVSYMEEIFGFSESVISTISVVAMGVLSILVLISICYPPNKLEKTLIIGASIFFMVGILFFKDFFEITGLKLFELFILVLLTAVGAAVMYSLTNISRKIKTRRDRDLYGGVENKKN